MAHAVEKAVAPAKTGIPVHAAVHAARIEHLLEVIEPFGAVAQPGQRHAAQGAAGALAGSAAVALQALHNPMAKDGPHVVIIQRV